VELAQGGSQVVPCIFPILALSSLLFELAFIADRGFRSIDLGVIIMLCLVLSILQGGHVSVRNLQVLIFSVRLIYYVRLDAALCPICFDQRRLS
jgi:hypothetical protein